MGAPPDPDPLATVTSTTLLEGLRESGNEAVWTAFVERYRPVLLGTLRRAGLPHEAREDVAQASLLAFSEAYRRGAYQRGRGRLRSWLFGIVRHELGDWRARSERREVQVAPDDSGTGLLERVAAPDALEPIWEEEWRASVLGACVDEVRREVSPTTLAAFEAVGLEGRAVDEVAAELGLTPNAVYGAKRRVLRRMRELLPRMEEIW